MKKKYILPGLIVGVVIVTIALVSCSNLIEDLRGRRTSDSFYPVIYGKNNTENYPGVFLEERNVRLSHFSMEKYEVTQKLYKEIMDGEMINGSPLDSDPSLCRETGDYPLAEGEIQNLRPVENINWYDAVYFCNVYTEKTLGADKKVYTISDIEVVNGHIREATVSMDRSKTGYRLPTEAEWEFAARGGDSSVPDWDYTFSGASLADGTVYTDEINSGLDSVGWYKYNNITGVTGDTEPTVGSIGYGTHEVGKKAPNRLGLYDMSGNVCEWCWDLYSSNVTYCDVPDSNGIVTDPVQTRYHHGSVIRGGSWYFTSNYSSVCHRGPLTLSRTVKADHCGFRVVRSVSN